MKIYHYGYIFLADICMTEMSLNDLLEKVNSKCGLHSEEWLRDFVILVSKAQKEPCGGASATCSSVVSSVVSSAVSSEEAAWVNQAHSSALSPRHSARCRDSSSLRGGDVLKYLEAYRQWDYLSF